ncbi:MAG: GAF domain-containing protein [Syntrophothermus sp.]
MKIGKKTILLVEDEALIALSEMKLLQKEGFNVIHVLSGESAIETVNSNVEQIDIILMDIDLGSKGLDGTEAARIILAENDIPLLFLSSHTEKEIVEKTEQITSYGYITKGSGETVLLASIKMAFRLNESKKKALKYSEQMNQIIKNSQDILYCRNTKKDCYEYMSPAIMNISGFIAEEMMNMPLNTYIGYIHPDDVEEIARMMNLSFANPGTSHQVEYRFRHKDKDHYNWYQDRFVSIANKEKGGEGYSIYGSIRDITEGKQANNLIQARLELMEFSHSHSLDEILQKTLDTACTISGSAIGFYHFVDSDQKTLLLQAWSTATLRDYCKAEGKGMHYSTDKAGIWADCVSTQKPVIHNDYASEKNKKGLPEGHASLIRELVVPILRENKVVAILGVGNKLSYYTEEDASLIGYFADIAWEIYSRKTIEERVNKLLSEKELLLKEVHHRIKNNMAMVHSILKLHSERYEDSQASDIIDEAANRIQSMMILYEKLYNTDYDREMDITVYLNSLLDRIALSFVQIANIEIIRNIENVSLNTKHFSPLGIIINELMTNAFKYAFHGKKNGVIGVSLSQRQDIVVLIIEDNGIGLPENEIFESPTGFGFQLVSALVKQMKAGLSIERTAGTRFIIEINP